MRKLFVFSLILVLIWVVCENTGPGFGPVMKRKLLEQNRAKMVHSSKLPDMALPCQTVARPCQALRHRHSQPALASISQIVKIQGSTTVPNSGTTVPGQNQLLISLFPRTMWLLPSTTGSHDQSVSEHGRATSGTFERDFSRNGSKQDWQTKSDSDTCQARPCQKVAW